MQFSHEKLDEYRAALEFMGIAHSLTAGDCEARYNIEDQLLRAASSIVLNIAEGNGKRTGADRRRFFEIARGSGMASAAKLDVLVVCGACSEAQIRAGKDLLLRIVAMLSKMTELQTGTVREQGTAYESLALGDINIGFENEYEYDDSRHGHPGSDQ